MRAYRDSFGVKTYGRENEEPDLLMDLFGITASRKREHRQYWGRELGMCWQLLVTGVLSHHCPDYAAPMKSGSDEPCDCRVGSDAIDTKYRIGSGDSGTLKKFRANGQWLTDRGYRPVLLILRGDSLASAIRACERGGWQVFVGSATFGYLHQLSGFDLYKWLMARRRSGEFVIDGK